MGGVAVCIPPLRAIFKFGRRVEEPPDALNSGSPPADMADFLGPLKSFFSTRTQDEKSPKDVTATLGPAPLATSVDGLKLSSCLFNSSNPFATNLEDLQALDVSASGAVATRTACPGFVHDEKTMKWASPDGKNTTNCETHSTIQSAHLPARLPDAPDVRNPTQASAIRLRRLSTTSRASPSFPATNQHGSPSQATPRRWLA